MSGKICVTTPVHFSVKEGIGTFRIALEIGGSDLPRVLDDALISIHPRPGVSFEKVQEIAGILRDNFEGFHFQHPIQQ